MASRLLRSPFLLRHVRHLKSTPPVSSPQLLHINHQSPVHDKKPIVQAPPVAETLDFTNHERLFATYSTPKLVRACGNLHAAAIQPMVDVGMSVMSSRLMDIDLFRYCVLKFVRATVYEHFCAGESAEEAVNCARKIHQSSGMKGMLVYGVEHTDDVSVCDQNLEKFMQTAQSAKSLTISFVIVKITALCPISLLKRVSDLLRWQYKNPSYKLPWKFNNFPLFADSSPMYHTMTEPEPLSPQEEQNLELAYQRLIKLSQKCQESNVPLSVDAEDTILQPAIDYLTYSLAIKYNKLYEHPVVYGTVQAYLKDAGERLHLAAKTADKMGIPMGFKLVRGAYMSSESRLATSLGFASPVHDSIQDTHDCYNNCASYLLEKIADGSGTGVVFATHNLESGLMPLIVTSNKFAVIDGADVTGQLAASKARELGIENQEERVGFAQLYGMADALSFGLRNAGFVVSKYMPFGPVDSAIPYLLRRAEENRGMLSASTLDRRLMREELKRRLKTALL